MIPLCTASFTAPKALVLIPFSLTNSSTQLNLFFAPVTCHNPAVNLPLPLLNLPPSLVALTVVEAIFVALPNKAAPLAQPATGIKMERVEATDTPLDNHQERLPGSISPSLYGFICIGAASLTAPLASTIKSEKKLPTSSVSSPSSLGIHCCISTK